jgi:hypothetical protein
MNKQQAHTIIRQTFENPFSKESYVGFIKNLLNSIEEAPFIYQGNLFPMHTSLISAYWSVSESTTTVKTK